MRFFGRPIAFRHTRLTLALAGFGLLGIAFVVSIAGATDRAGVVLSALDRLRELGWRGWLVFVAIQATVALIGFLPASFLGLAAGAIYGVWLGFGLAAAGIMIGAIIAFGIARSALRPSIAHLIDGRPALFRFDAALAREGWRLVLLMRVSPAMPFSLTSYALGLSAVGLRDYALGTLASLPALLLYVILGTFGTNAVAAARGGAATPHLALVGIGVIATVLLMLKIGRLLTMTLQGRPSSEKKLDDAARRQ